MYIIANLAWKYIKLGPHFKRPAHISNACWHHDAEHVRERKLLIKFYLQVKNHRVVKENKQGDVRVHYYEKKVHVKLMIMKKRQREKVFFY